MKLFIADLTLEGVGAFNDPRIVYMFKWNDK